MAMTRIEPRVMSEVSPPTRSELMPRRMRGRAKNTTARYRKGNPRHQRVAFPSDLAIAIGTRRMRGTGYQIIMPKMLKKKCASAGGGANVISTYWIEKKRLTHLTTK